MTRESPYVFVCGSVEWCWFEPIYAELRALPRGTIIVHGAARGADSLADTAAKRLGFDVEPVPAKWEVGPDTPPGAVRRRRGGELYDVRAGYLRNIEVLDRYRPRAGLAFQLDRSGGTAQMVREARKRGIPVKVTSRFSAGPKAGGLFVEDWS